MSIHPLPVHDNTTDSRPSLSPLSEQCSALRARLMQIRGFPHYFSLLSPDNDRSIDSVTELWDLFSLGGSLCYLFDQLPEEGGFHKINNNSRFEEHYEVTPARAQVHAIALFCMQIRGLAVKQNIPDCECFTITDLYDHTSTEGFTKALTTVTAIVNHLPAYVFETSPPSLDTPDPNDRSPVTNNAQETRRNSIIYELVETERKYVQNLDMMQKYVTTLSQSNLIDRETIHLLFPNVDKLVDFQRKFLMGIDAIAELSWQDQRWGQHFIQAEEEFSVYHTYSANYDNASELLVADDLQEKLAEFNHILPVTELPVCMIRPVSRVYKYPLLIDALLNASSTTEYRHYEELKRGSEAIKRVTGQVDGARRRSANAQTVKSLPARISDWKGHNLETFGELLLYDVLMFTSSNITREFHVFLFEKVILCCREAPKASSTGRKFGKKSILKTQVYNPCISLGRPVDATPLLLKGRIFVRDVTQAILALPSSPSACSVPREYPLTVWWKRDNVPDFFTIRCRHEHRMQKWESEINQLISKSGGPLEDQTLDPEQSGVSQNSPLYDQLLRAGIHNLENFGELVLDDIFMVTSSNITLEFHVFLFEKAILCCGEGSSNGQKFGKRNARTTPLVLKGRIFLQDVVQAALTSPRSLNSASGISQQHSLTVWWTRDNGPEFFTVCSSDKYQMQEWESQINRLIGESGRLSNDPPTESCGFDLNEDDVEEISAPHDDRTGAHSGFGSPIETEWLEVSIPDTIPKDSQPPPQLEVPSANTPYVKVKVHFNEDIFVMRVTEAESAGLIERIERRICLCDSWRDDGPLLFEYEDKAGYVVPLGSTEDVQTAFEECQPGDRFVLYVT